MGIEMLIKRLRTESLYRDKCTLEIMDLCMEAAEALERPNDFNESQCAKLLAELGRVRRERDAALEQLHGQCKYCKHKSHMLESPCKGCVWFAAQEFIEGDYWEWIGLQKEAQG